MSRLTRDGTAEPVSRDHILRHARGQGNINFPRSADHEQDWQPYPVDPYSATVYVTTIHTYIHTLLLLLLLFVVSHIQRIGCQPEISVSMARCNLRPPKSMSVAVYSIVITTTITNTKPHY